VQLWYGSSAEKRKQGAIVAVIGDVRWTAAWHLKHLITCGDIDKIYGLMTQ